MNEFVSARLRHIVLAAESLAPSVDAARGGLGLEPGIADPAGMVPFDLEHEVLLLGSAYLEIVAPLGHRTESAAARFLARGGPGGYMLDLQVPDLDLVLSRLAGLGLAPVLTDVYRGNRICQLHPRDFGTLLEVDQIAAGGDWHWDAEFPSSSRAVERARPVAAVIAVPDPSLTAERWASVFGGALGPGSVFGGALGPGSVFGGALGPGSVFGGALGPGSVGLAEFTVSFAAAGDGRPGLRSVDVVVPASGEPGEVEIAGVVFRRFPGRPS